jgi:uncharacterized protein (TIGR02145 family)
MCFNLGARNEITIQEQITTTLPDYTYNANGANPVSGLHDYVDGEEDLWGSLFQWGRIADGHEERLAPTSGSGTSASYSNTVAYDNSSPATRPVLASGNRCTATDIRRPYNQIAPTSTTYYEKFIYGQSVWWNTDVATVPQTTADQLWRSGRFALNDPCAHYKTDGSYQAFWNGDGTTNNVVASVPACTDAGTGWRTPSQEEWGAIFKGGTISGSKDIATANTWVWVGGTSGPNDITANRGYTIRPNGATTTLFLPASGYRTSGSALFYSQGATGYYWSTSAIGTSAYYLLFTGSSVNPASSTNRANGFALRCIKN